MPDLPTPESNDPREQDAGELFRPSQRQLPTVPMKSSERRVIYGLLAAALSLAVAVVALNR